MQVVGAERGAVCIMSDDKVHGEPWRIDNCRGYLHESVIARAVIYASGCTVHTNQLPV